jgi:acetoin utilization deacetylase AcuC-like enzyme
VRELLVTEQGSCREAVATWVVEGGRAVSGREDDRRLAELRRGLQRHPGVRLQPARTADETVERTLRALHDVDYLEALDQIGPDEPVVIPELTAPGLEPDVPVCASLVRAARGGVKTAIASAEGLTSGAQLTYALSRPPGHHAGPAWFGGYCYLNTAAAAAFTLLDRGVSMVGILDLDLHYPNGTSAIVESIDGVRLHSLHSSALPVATLERAAARADAECQVVFDWAPTAFEYLTALASSIAALTGSVDALVVSLGYDTLRNDPHGCWSFSPAIFVQIGRLIASSRLPVCVIQEGGYSLGRLAACSYAFATGLLEWGVESRGAFDGGGTRRVRSRQRRGAHGRHVV